MRARLHDRAFHCREHEFGETVDIEIRRQPVAGCFETGAHCTDPAGEIQRQQLAHGRIGLMQFQREAADRAAVLAFGLQQRAAIAGEQGEDLVDRIIDALPGRLQQHRIDAVAIRVEHGQQQVLLARKEVVEAAAVHVSGLAHVGDARRGIAFFGEQPQRGVDEAIAGGLAWHLIDRSTKSR